MILPWILLMLLMLVAGSWLMTSLFHPFVPFWLALVLGIVVYVLIFAGVAVLDASGKLLEILIPNGIVLILMVILVPVFQQARSKARQAACTGNMKALCMAFLQYRADYGDNLPPLSHWSVATDYLPAKDRKSLTHCPEARTSYSYALNPVAGQQPAAKHPLPATLVLLLEMDTTNPNASGGRQALPKTPRHSGCDVYAFLDGSARAVPRSHSRRLVWTQQ